MNQQIFGLIIILTGLLMLCGCGQYQESERFVKLSDEVALIDFESSLQSAVELNAYSFGSMQILDFAVPLEYDEVCFLSPSQVSLKKGSQEIYAFNIDLMGIMSDFCVEPVDGQITLEIAGKGDYSTVSKI